MSDIIYYTDPSFPPPPVAIGECTVFDTINKIYYKWNKETKEWQIMTNEELILKDK